MEENKPQQYTKAETNLARNIGVRIVFAVLVVVVYWFFSHVGNLFNKKSNDPIAQAVNLYNEKNYTESLAIVSKITEANTNDSKAFTLKGANEIMLGNTDIAIIDLTHALENKTNTEADRLAYAERGSIYVKQKHDYEKAILDFNMALQSSNPPDPNNFLYFDDSIIYFVRGTSYGLLHKYQEALDDFNKVLELDKNLPNVYQSKGEMEIGLKDIKNGCVDMKTNLSNAAEESRQGFESIIKKYCN